MAAQASRRRPTVGPEAKAASSPAPGSPALTARTNARRLYRFGRRLQRRRRLPGGGPEQRAARPLSPSSGLSWPAISRACAALHRALLSPSPLSLVTTPSSALLFFLVAAAQQAIKHRQAPGPPCSAPLPRFPFPLALVWFCCRSTAPVLAPAPPRRHTESRPRLASPTR